MHACCHSRPTGSPDECCGHKKSDAFHTDLISPLEADCSSHFTYDLAGQILPADSRGTVTISMLNLNSGLLVASRKSLIDFFLNLDPADLQTEIELHLDDTKPVLSEFFTMIEYHSKNGNL